MTKNFAHLSILETERLLISNLTSRLRLPFILSRDVAQRALPDIVEEDNRIINNYISSLQDIQQKLWAILDSLDAAEASLQQMFSDLENRLWFHFHKGLEGVDFILEHDFIGGWQMAKERVLRYANHNFQSFASSFRQFLDQIQENEDETSVYQALEQILRNLLEVRSTMLTRALREITTTHNAYVDGEPLYRIELTPGGRYDEAYITPEVLDVENIDRRRLMTKLRQTSRTMDANIGVYNEILTDFLESFQLTDLDRLDENEQEFIDTSKVYSLYLENYELTIINQPRDTVEQKLEAFRITNRTVYNTRDQLLQTIQTIRDLVADMNSSDWLVIMETARESVRYVTDLTYQKRDLAERLSTPEVESTIVNIHQFFTHLRARGLDLSDKWLYIQNAVRDVWGSMLMDEATVPLYQAINQDFNDYLSRNDTQELSEVFSSMLGMSVPELEALDPGVLLRRLNADFPDTNVSIKMEEIQRDFDNLDQRTGLADILADTDDNFEAAVDEYFNYQYEYVISTEINQQFYT